MPTLTVISWNVQHLGEAKTSNLAATPDQCDVAQLIALVIRRMVANVVGIMEVNSGKGAEIKNWLLAILNNDPGLTGRWEGRVSARQDAGTQEEYIYLWREEANKVVLDVAGRPAPISLVGVVDVNLLEPLITANGWGKTETDQLYAALEANGYIEHAGYGSGGHTKTATWRVVPDAWGGLDEMMAPASVEFDATLPLPPPPLDQATPAGDAAREALAEQLLDTDMLLFLKYQERSPFLANFRVGPMPGKPLAVALFHTLGSGERAADIGAANNNVGMSRPLAAAAAHGNVVLMGDWNIPANKMYIDVDGYSRTDRDGDYKFGRAYPRVRTPVFGTITGGDLNAANLSGVQLTSMKSTYLPDTVAADDVLKNAYDKFFYHAATPPDPAITADGDPMVLNLAPYLAQGQPTFDPELARYATAFYRVFKGDARAQTVLTTSLAAVRTTQAALDRAIAKAPTVPSGPVPTIKKKTAKGRRAKSSATDVTRLRQKLDAFTGQAATAQTLIDIVGLATQVAATGNGSAAVMFNAAVSDHVPIALRLRY